MTVKELREEAKKLGLTGYSKLRKAELEKLIEDTKEYNRAHELHNSEILFRGQCSGDGEWLKYRKIGATDTAILIIDNAFRTEILNRPDKYSSPYLIWAEKKGIYSRDFSFEQKVAMDFGHFAEDFMIANIPKLFKKEFDIKVEEVRKGDQVVWNKKYPLWTCTPDSWVKLKGKWYPVELKTGNSHMAKEWETEKVPDKYFSQVQQQLAVLGKEKGFIFGFVDNKFTKVYEVKRDNELIELAYDLTKNFQEYLDKNIEPELNGCEAECEFLKKEFKGFKTQEDNIPIINIAQETLEEYSNKLETKKFINQELKDINFELDTFNVKIQKTMLDLKTETLIINNNYLATWKINARGAKTFKMKLIKQDKAVA